MFCKKDDAGYHQIIKGISRKTLTFGQNTLFTEFRLEAGNSLPRHAHCEEQTGYLVAGALLLTIADETFSVGPGDCWCIPGNVEHSAEILSDSLAIEVFSPVRKDYLPEEK